MLRSRFAFLTLVAAFVVSSACGAQTSYRPVPARGGSASKPTIVLVHGAFADASGWDGVIRILQAKGYEVSAVQNPLIGSVFAATARNIAWRTTPSWYIVAQHDNIINPDQERFYAKRMGATTIELNASHVAFMSHPKEVASTIESAARATAARTQP